jgi:hypothetical protein
MRSTKSLWLALLILTVALGACKKGEEDPFFSLLSRKARVSGEWKMSSIEAEDYQEFLVGGEWFRTIRVGDGDKIVVTRTWSSSTDIIGRTNTVQDYSMQINKDGTWSRSVMLDISEIQDTEDRTSTITYSIDHKFSGTWAFLGKTKDAYKNKERIMLSATNVVKQPRTQTEITVFKDGSPTTEFTSEFAGSNDIYSNGQLDAVYDLVMLKSKEMKMSFVSGYLSSQIDMDESTTETFTNSMTETIVWKQ